MYRFYQLPAVDTTSRSYNFVYRIRSNWSRQRVVIFLDGRENLLPRLIFPAIRDRSPKSSPSLHPISHINLYTHQQQSSYHNQSRSTPFFLWSTSFSFRFYHFRIFTPHNTTKPSKSILTHRTHNRRCYYSYGSSYLFVSYPYLLLSPPSSSYSRLGYTRPLHYFLGPTS